MFRFLLFLKGYFLIEISGYGAERFVNLCKIRQIYLWELKPSLGKYLVKISASDFDLLDEIIHKTDVKVDILKKYGLPFFFRKKISRLYYLIFLLLAATLIFISNLFVWKIEFDGNFSVSDEQLEDFLHKNSVDVGCLKSSIAFEQMEKSLRKEYNVIKWCSIAIKGNTLYVNIEENNLYDNKKTDSNTENGYSDIVAAYDGVVKKIMVRNGIPMVKVGDTVKKGQILITGAVPIFDDAMELKSYHFYHADGDIELQTTLTYEEAIEDEYQKKVYTGRKKSVHYLKIKDADVHLPFKPSYAKYDIYTTSNRFVLFNTIKTPVYYGKYEAREYYLEERKYEKEEVVNVANEKLKLYYESLSQKGVQIIKKDVKIEYNANNWVISGNFVVSVTHMEKIYREQVENIIQ